MSTMTEPKVVVSSQISRDQREQLARLAAEHERTISAELRRAVRLYLERPERRP